MKQRITRIGKQPKVMISACIALVLLVGLVLLCTITGEKQNANAGENDGFMTDSASSEAPMEADATPLQQNHTDDSTAKEMQELFHKMVSEGGMYHLTVYQIVCDQNAAGLSNRPDLVSQYQLDTLFTEDVIQNALIYRLSEAYDTEYAVTYNRLCNEQAFPWEPLLLSPDCSYYIAKTVGSLEQTAVDYQEFISYFLEYDTQGKQCQVFFENGSICEILLIDPYKDIYFQNIRSDHYFYETYGTDEYYELAAAYEADVEHTVDQAGSEKELIEVYSGNVGDGGNGIVLIKSASGDVIWEIEAHTAHVGWNNIYLTELDGKEYLLELQIDSRHTYGGYSYYVYSLEQQLGVWDAPILFSGASYSYGTIEELENGNYAMWADAMNPYLENATLLLSTQDGVIRTEPVNEYEKYNKEALIKDILEN